MIELCWVISSDDSEISQAIDAFADVIKSETLAVELNSVVNESEKYDAKIEGKLVEIFPEKKLKKPIL